MSRRRIRRSCRPYMSSNVVQKDKLRLNKPSKCAQKDPLWFNKLLILLHSGRRPPLYFFRVFAREEQRLIIPHQESPADTRKPGCSLLLPARDGRGVVPRPPRKRGATAGRPKRGGASGRDCRRRAWRPVGATSPRGCGRPDWTSLAYPRHAPFCTCKRRDNRVAGFIPE